jgi:SPP1 family phage portal protein
MPNESEILARLTAFMRTELPRLKRLGAYYLGRHGILRAPRDPGKPDNRLVNSFCRNITDCTVGYFMGRGVAYSSSDKRTAAMVERVGAENSERFVNNALARDLSVYGRAAELLWYEDVAHPRFTPLPVTSVIPVYDDTVDPRLRYAIRFFRPADSGETRVEVYTDRDMRAYVWDGTALLPRGRRPHWFGKVPVIFYDNNRDRQGDFEPVLTLVDAYDRLQSASVNDFELFADSYLAISGMGATDAEDLARIRRDRVILLDEGGDARWLTKTVNDAYIENLKARIAKDIYRFSGTVDMAEETLAGGTLSGVAIRYRLLNFENRVSVTEQYFRRSLTERWRCICRLFGMMGEGYDAETIRMHFVRNLPGLPEESAEMARKLTGILSRRTVVEQLPMVEDAAAEMARIAEESAPAKEKEEA